MEGSSFLLSPVAYRLLPVLQFCPILRATDFGWVTRSGHIFDPTSSPGLALPSRLNWYRMQETRPDPRHFVYGEFF